MEFMSAHPSLLMLIPRQLIPLGEVFGAKQRHQGHGERLSRGEGLRLLIGASGYLKYFCTNEGGDPTLVGQFIPVV